MFIPIPKPYTPAYDIKVNGTSVKNDVIKASFSKPVAEEGVGFFVIELENNNGTYTDSYSGGEAVLIYFDNSAGNTLRFSGFVEMPKRVYDDKYGSVMRLEGLHDSGKLLEIGVAASFTDTEPSAILKSIIASHATGFTYAEADIVASSITVSIVWNDKPFWECFGDLCKIANYDGYVDDSLGFHFFPKSSIENQDEAIVFKDNHLDTRGLGDSTVQVKNSVIVYGKQDSETPVIYRTSDASSQVNYTKETVLRDSNVKTYAEAKALGDAELERQKTVSLRGKSNALALYTICPGDVIWLNIQPLGIYNKYRIINCTHDIDNGYCTSEVEIEKAGGSIPSYFQQQFAKNLAGENINNPNSMNYSYNFDFDDDTGLTLSNMEVSEGYLRVTSGNNSGSAISEARTADSDITSVELRAIGEGLADCLFSFSVDGGTSWESILLRSATTPVSSGKKLCLKVEANVSTVSIDSVALLYK